MGGADFYAITLYHNKKRQGTTTKVSIPRTQPQLYHNKKRQGTIGFPKRLRQYFLHQQQYFTGWFKPANFQHSYEDPVAKLDSFGGDRTIC